MEELTESARQSLVSQGIVVGTLSVLNSLGLLLTGIVVICRAKDILHFTSLTHLAVLELACGVSSILAVAYVLWIVVAYRSRQLEIRSKYLDEKLSRGLVAIVLTILISFSALVVSAIFLMLKIDSSSNYELKSAMSLYAMDCSRKVVMDRLQILFECCGSTSLLDWFLIDWQNPDQGNELVNETFMDWDSVPFSCCNPQAPPPCVHHQLRAFGVGSIFSTGCANKLDEAVFTFVLIALIMLFICTFLMLILLYSSRKLQTSARSAISKGDATAPGSWWLLSPAGSAHTNECGDFTPLLGETGNHRGSHHPSGGPWLTNSPFFVDKRQTRDQKKKSLRQLQDYYCQPSTAMASPFYKNTRHVDSTENDDWETFKSETKNMDGDSSEDWTRRANDASGSTSSTSFLTTTRPINSTPETRHSVSDTAVANLEVSHHFEHKIRPLYRS